MSNFTSCQRILGQIIFNGLPAAQGNKNLPAKNSNIGQQDKKCGISTKVIFAHQTDWQKHSEQIIHTARLLLLASAYTVTQNGLFRQETIALLYALVGQKVSVSH